MMTIVSKQSYFRLILNSCLSVKNRRKPLYKISLQLITTKYSTKNRKYFSGIISGNCKNAAVNSRFEHLMVFSYRGKVVSIKKWFVLIIFLMRNARFMLSSK